ncbi:helix-turn-helix domain-containing protein [Nocardiopsis dassonvillei]|uniref:helix-turn-helix domain-containing protein n=1 Tax=Nocardiopsis dassonvillei TaxID=2014 RepID=UPI003F57BDD0
MDATDKQHRRMTAATLFEQGQLRDSQIAQILRRGAKDYGFSTHGWTLARIRRVIHETFGVLYADLSGMWRLLHRMGWTNQLPARRALERDEDAIAEWVARTWPDIEKRGPARGHGSASRTNRGPR